MRFFTALMMTALTASPALLAQAPAPAAAPAPPPAAATANPVVWSADQIYARQAKFIVAAAEEMPADKYSYHPTPDQWTFAKIISHVAQSNGGICAVLSDDPAPPATKVPETASKADLLVALNASFDFCHLLPRRPRPPRPRPHRDHRRPRRPLLPTRRLPPPQRHVATLRRPEEVAR